MKKTILDNGVTVITHKMPSRIVAVSCRLKGGAAYEAPHQHGMAHYLEHVIISDRHNITRPLEQIGVELNAFTSHNAITLSSTSMPAHLPQALGTILQYGLVAPGFTTHDVARERQAILNEIIDVGSDPFARLQLARDQAMCAGTPYARSILGTEAEVRAIRR